MKILIVIITTLFCYTASANDTLLQAQKFSNKNSLQFELFGHGLLYSFNYERILINKNRFKTAAQVGVSYYPPATGYIGLWVPVSINEIISFNKHHIELGVGCIFVKDWLFPKEIWQKANNKWGRLGSFELGYRYQKPNGRFLFKAAVTPFIEFFNTNLRQFEASIYPSGGLTFGYCF